MPPRLKTFVDYVTPKLLGQLTASALALWVPVVIFAALAIEVTEPTPLSFDLPILHYLHGIASPNVDRAALLVTQLGSFWFIMAATLGLALGFYRFGSRRAAYTVIFASVGSAVINLLLKATFQRDRPDLWQTIVAERSYSFPSGHSMASSALAFAIMLILWPTKWRWLAVVLGGAYVVLVGMSRVYLGVHYPSDVAAGWCVSLAWVIILNRVLGRHAKA